MSAIQEETEEISPTITLLRKPRFSKHFPPTRRTDNKIVSTSGRFAGSSGSESAGNVNGRGVLSEPEVGSRRSSDSSLSSASFKVLPPIQNIESTEANNNDDSADGSSSVNKDKDKEEKVNEEDENTSKPEVKDGGDDIEQMVAETLSTKISRMRDSGK